MKRALLSQIKNEWKENVWLVIELLIVSLVIWTLTLFIIRKIRDISAPRGFDVTDVYAGGIAFTDSAGQQIYGGNFPEDRKAGYVADLQALIDNLRNLPMVESVAVGLNMLPYDLGAQVTGLAILQGKDTLWQSFNCRYMTPDGADVIGISPLDPESAASSPSARLKEGMVLLSSSKDMEDAGMDIGKAIAESRITNIKDADFSPDLIQHVRRSDYEITSYGTMAIPLKENTPNILTASQIGIRLKPGTEPQFRKLIDSDVSYSSRRNVTITNIHPIDHDRRRTVWNNQVTQRAMTSGVILLLFIVFLGLLGTFWFRIYLRTPDIAIRKTFGASDANIFRRLISEAMLLLGAAFLIAIPLSIFLVSEIENHTMAYITSFNTWEWDFALAGALTFALMALMILVGVGIPARRAMKIQPAIALKEE